VTSTLTPTHLLSADVVSVHFNRLKLLTIALTIASAERRVQ